MPTAPQIRPYRWLAEHYDTLFQGLYDAGFDPAREKILGPALSRASSACDLACGTGRLAVLFAKRGFRTYAVDLSPAMCRLTRAKAQQAKARVNVIRADMRDFRLPEPVDIVTCEYDALNHVPEKTDLPKVARAVERALNPGGHFFFDVNTRLAFEHNWKASWMLEKPGVVMMMQSGSEPENDRAWTNVHWFFEEGRNCWKRRTEYVEEVCWSEREIRRALKDAGFDRVQAFDSAPFFESPFFLPGYRTFFLARKAR